MTTANELARYIISEIKKHMEGIQPEEFDVTPLKLQKLLYYCQGYSLALTGKPLFKDKIEAWKYGPVVDSVYQEYKKYNRGIIPYQKIEDEEIPDETLQAIVRLVLSDKLRYSGTALAQATHNEAPWKNNYQASCGILYMNAEIPESEMKDYFVGEFHKREEDYDDEDICWEKITEQASLSELEAVLEEI
ncbi:MAG: SocA family protein [Synergistaceae bacterium]|nr:SocA family protein [Synergistaceae bacterium]